LAVLLSGGCSASPIQPKPTLHVAPIAVDLQATGLKWAGLWRTNWGELALFPDGKVVRGVFRYLSSGVERVGLLIGEPQGNRMAFRWMEQKGADKGLGVFVLGADSAAFSGSFGYDGSETDGGEWCGLREGKAAH
jgi:hypothetical protein